jgi:hypothetical protein
LTQQQSEVVSKDHAAGVGVHERVILKVLIAKHCVRAPATDKRDDVSILTHIKASHGTTSLEAVSGCQEED